MIRKDDTDPLGPIGSRFEEGLERAASKFESGRAKATSRLDRVEKGSRLPDELVFPLHGQLIADSPTCWQSSPWVAARYIPEIAGDCPNPELARSLLRCPHRVFGLDQEDNGHV